MIHIYGIKNCNTVKKALDWLGEHKVEFTFHDFKKEPATQSRLEKWGQYTGWEALVNKKGTTWRKLSPAQQMEVTSADAANKVLLANNSMIKRPVIELSNDVILGFDEESYKSRIL